MIYNPIVLDKENDLNKILKENKKDPRDMSILFVSQWDDLCESLEHKMHEQWVLEDFEPPDHAQPLYIVNSFDMPHSFVIFKTTKVPHLVQFKGDDITSEDYYPKVLEGLGLS
tara:strand:+ start:47 stop:385 length:339 start_codon:yes stop_codon:yes gene_type:complete